MIGLSARPRRQQLSHPHEPSPAQGEVQLARQIVDDMEKRTTAGQLTDPESYNTWSLRLLEAEKRQPSENSPPISPPAAAYEGHVQRMTRMLQSAEKLAKAGSSPRTISHAGNTSPRKPSACWMKPRERTGRRHNDGHDAQYDAWWGTDVRSDGDGPGCDDARGPGPAEASGR